MHKDDLPISEPCGADWSAMRAAPEEGRGARHCEHCDKAVHDLSDLTEREAEALLRSGTPCVRYAATPDGEIRHRPLRGRSRASRLIAMAGLMASLPLLAGFYTSEEPPSWIVWLRDQISGQPAEVPPAEEAPGSEAPAPGPALESDHHDEPEERFVQTMGVVAPTPNPTVLRDRVADEAGRYLVHHTDVTVRRRSEVLVPEGQDWPAAGRLRCIASLDIDEGGVVHAVEVHECPPAFQSAVREALSKWRFYPAIVDGRAVPVRTQLRIVLRRH